MVLTKYFWKVSKVYMITISKIDETYLKIDGDIGLLAKIKDHFSYYAKGYKYSPAYKARRWDGKISYFNITNRSLFIGLYDDLIKFLDKYDIKYQSEYNSEEYNLDIKDILNFIDTINLPFPPRDYQLYMVYRALKKRRGIFLAATASGKSLNQYIISRYLISNGHKILMIVPKVSLVEQMYGDFKEYGINVEKHIHKIYSGQNYHSDKDIIITTYQSLKNIKKKTLDSVTAVLVDETHTAANTTIKNFLIKMNHCEYKLGFTGTLPDDLASVKLIEGLLGSSESIITAEELIKRGYSPKLTIEAQILKHNYKRFNNYHDEIDYICSNDLRNNYIKNLCESLEGNTLVLFNYIETHGKLIYEKLLELDKDVHFIYGGTEIDTREDIRKLAENNENVIICASLGCFSTGINVKRLHNIIFASSTKSRVLGLQSIGRGLRKHKSKDKITVYDLVDDFSDNKKSSKNYTLKHFDQRLKYYQEENFNVNVNEIDLVE